MGAAFLLPEASWSAPAGLDPRYLALLRQYAAGERPQAVGALGQWSPHELRKQLGVVQDARAAAEKCPECPDPLAGTPLRAAVMLHHDRDRADRPRPSGREQLPRCPGPQARLARDYAATLARIAETREFARRFFLASTLSFQLEACFEDALGQAHAGLDLFPRDAKLLLAAASVLEEEATLPIRGERSSAAALRRDWLTSARRDLGEAVAADPDLGLARVRLGRVLWGLGDAAKARDVLEAAVARARKGSDRYLAHLFLGRVHEDAGRLDEALVQYRLAGDLDPGAQSAAIALSHVLLLTGDREGARKALAPGLVRRETARDAYWDYLVSNARGVEDMFTALHREALQ